MNLNPQNYPGRKQLIRFLLILASQIFSMDLISGPLSVFRLLKTPGCSHIGPLGFQGYSWSLPRKVVRLSMSEIKTHPTSAVNV
jgi:hypothetical protein